MVEQNWEGGIGGKEKMCGRNESREIVEEKRRR